MNDNWKVEGTEDRIVIRDPSGLKRFIGSKDALIHSWVWLMQEYDRLRQDITPLPERIQRALAYADYDGDEDKSPQTIADKQRISDACQALKKKYSYTDASAFARREFVADLLRSVTSPLQRAAENRLTHEEADAAGKTCPGCSFINYHHRPETYSCGLCGKEGFNCCVNPETDICYECEGKQK